MATIYCIAGPPRVGKSTLGRRIATRLGIACLPTDSIRVALETAASDDERPRRFPVSAYRASSDNSSAGLLATVPTAELVAAYETEAASCWPAIRSVVHFFAHREESIVLEGCQLRPTTVSTLESTMGDTELKILVLARLDPAATQTAIRRSQLTAGWLAPHVDQLDAVARYAAFVTTLGATIAREADETDWPTISVDDNFDQALADAEATIVGGGNPIA